jgi:hypothetical protein
MKAACTESEFIELLKKNGAHKTARILGLHPDNVFKRRRRLEKKHNTILRNDDFRSPTRTVEEHPARRQVEIKNGHVLIGSDSHYFPGIVSTAHRAFVKFCEDIKPDIVIKNGDEIDGAAISRHPPIGWESKPTVQMEVEAASERLEEIFQASKNAKHIWPLGNHDGRYETRLATVAPEFAKMHGFHLKDHFPGWQPCWSVWLNDDVVVKHRYKGGVHATHNNTVASGKTIVTGHLHSLKVTPYSDYNGTRWGVDCGTLAEPYGPQFIDYTEDSPVNWRSGFVMLTFHKGKLLDPETIRVWDENHVCFRGQLIEV